MQDKIGKGRQPKGQTTGKAKLFDEQVLAIIAADFGIDQSTVSDIKTGASWSHLTGL